MKKLFYKNEILFAVIWIVIYVVGFSNADLISEKIGVEKSVTAGLGLVLSAILFLFARRNKLNEYLGLCAFRGDVKKHLYFLPLIVLSLVNVWNGFQMNMEILPSIFYVISMLFVGFLEEIIFRGFLFNAMRKDGLASAVIVSSLTFGIGHAVNLLLGAQVLETILQLIYTSAIGFLFTALFLSGKSILPLIVSHMFINATSVFARPLPHTADILLAAFQTVLAVAYGAWILKKAYRAQEKGA